MIEFFAIVGAAALCGMTLAIANFPAAVRCIQAEATHGQAKGSLPVILAIAAAHGIWALPALLIVTGTALTHSPPAWVLRLAAAGILLQVMLGLFQSTPVKRLRLDGPDADPATLRERTWRLALAQPFRFPTLLAVFLAVGMADFEPSPLALLPACLAVACTTAAWLWFLALVARRYADSIPESVSLDSLNKLRRISILIHAVFLGIASVGALAGLLP